MTDITRSAAARAAYREENANGLRTAAELITAAGYTCYPEDEPGIDIMTALDQAAGAVGVFTDQLAAAFAGWLYMAGVTASGFRREPEATIVAWEREGFGARPVTEVLAELQAAAAALDPKHADAV